MAELCGPERKVKRQVEWIRLFRVIRIGSFQCVVARINILIPDRNSKAPVTVMINLPVKLSTVSPQIERPIICFPYKPISTGLGNWEPPIASHHNGHRKRKYWQERNGLPMLECYLGFWISCCASSHMPGFRLLQLAFSIGYYCALIFPLDLNAAQLGLPRTFAQKCTVGAVRFCN